MLGALQLHKFRGFNAYELGDLNRVNLLVGKNNCGKTSILEAMHFLASKGDPRVLARSANRRREIGYDDGRGEQEESVDISHCFFGHRYDPGTGFRLFSPGYRQISARIHQLDFDDVFVNDDNPIESLQEDIDQFSPLVLRIEGSGLATRDLFITRSSSGSLLIPKYARFRGPLVQDRTPQTPVQFVTPESLDPSTLRGIWNRVLEEGRESEVIAAMKLLEENLESIHFLTGDASPRGRSERMSVLLGFRGGGRRVPLGSYGDGMRRLLALSLSLIQTEEGVLLIDEIDTGLHWTVMAEMWRMVIATARQHAVQVFATTHSYDCLRGLADLVESHPQLAQDVSCQKIEKTLNKAVRFDARDIQAAVEQNIEVR